MFESNGFRQMVAPYLLTKPGGEALGLARDGEGWEAMAMRDELTDVMLHGAFGKLILEEVRFFFPRTSTSPVGRFGSVRHHTRAVRASFIPPVVFSFSRPTPANYVVSRRVVSGTPWSSGSA